MRALYTMQVVCAKLLPVEVPHDSYGAAVQQMASWKARFMAHGFVTLFETFVALASMARSDSLHMTMLTTSLSVVKACLVGYLHANNGACQDGGKYRLKLHGTPTSRISGKRLFLTYPRTIPKKTISDEEATT